MCGLFVFLVLRPLNSFTALMSVDYFNANVYSAAAPSGACCVGLLFGTQPCFSGSLFWSVCAEGLLIVVPDGTKSGWVGRWVRACVRKRCVRLVHRVVFLWCVCCDPIPNLLRDGLPMICWTARRKFIGLGAEAPPLLAVSRTTRINNFLKCLVAIVFYTNMQIGH